jgi:hypothetical protein
MPVAEGCRPSRWLLLSLSALMLAACGSSTLAPQQADQEAKQFPPPEPGKGALYVYRSSWFGAARALDVSLVGGATAGLAPNRYIRVEGPPGPVQVDCRIGDKTGTAQVPIADGQIRYIEASMTIGWWTPGCEVEEVPPDKGQAAVRSSLRVEPQ